MEAKVDIRRLQMLNDRIAQTLDALNQLRLTVQAVGQTSAIPGVGYPGVGVNHTTAVQGYGQVPGVGQVPFGQVAPWYGNFPQQTFPNLFGQQNAWNGLSHTTPEQIFGIGNTTGFNTGFGFAGQNGYGVDPYFQSFQTRVNPMFPLAQWPVTPFV